MGARVSVVIPFYRRQSVFDETMQSIKNQTVQPMEVIVVDDASGGDALEFLQQYTPMITIIALDKNGGVSNARNVGAAAARGEFIAFLDSDDIWEPNKLEVQLRYFEENPDCDLVHTGCVNFYPNNKEEIFIDKPIQLKIDHLIQSSHIMFQSAMVRTNVYRKLGGFDSSFRQTEDYEFSMRMVSQGCRVDFIPLPLTRIRHGLSDKLSKNWKGFISGHVRVVWKYRQFYQQIEGPFSVVKHTAKYLVKGGYKKGGLAGRLITLLGRVLYPFPGLTR